MSKKRKLITYVGILLTLLALTASVAPRQAVEANQPPGIAGTGGGVIQSVYTATSPTIDGVITEGEWQNQRSIILSGFFDPSVTRSADIYLMNDATNLYVAIVLRGDRRSGDGIFIDIDAGHDHVATKGGEDIFGYNMDGNLKNRGFGTLYNDGHWNAEGTGWVPDTQEQGAGVRVVNFNTDTYTYEFSHPLSSGDPQDMAVAPGGVVGFRIEAWRGDTTAPEEYLRWPPNTVDAADTTRWNEWADLYVAAAATPSATPLPTTTSIPQPSPTPTAGPSPQPSPLVTATATTTPPPLVSQQLSPISSQLALVVYFNPADTNDPWKLYDPAAPPFVSDLQQLEIGRGYWVKLNQAATFTMGATSLPLRPGWNLMGWLG